MNLNPQQKQKLLKLYPQLSPFFQQQELISKIPKGEKGDKGNDGKDGYTPVKGKDYFTPNEVNQLAHYVKDNVVTEDILKKSTPIKGKHYFDGKDYVLTKEDKKEIAQSIDVPIVEKTEIIKEVLPKLNVSMVDGAVSKKDLLSGMAKVDGRFKLIDQRWHGGGLSQVYHDTTLTGTGSPSSPLSVIGGAFPSMTTAQRLASSATGGQTAYDTDIGAPYIAIAGTWYALQVS